MAPTFAVTTKSKKKLEGTRVKTLTVSNFVNCMIQLADGAVCIGTGNCENEIWDVSSGTRVKTFSTYPATTACMIQLANGAMCSCFRGNDEKTIKIWNVGTGRYRRTLKGHTKDVICVMQLADGRVCSGSFDQTMKIWDVSSGTCVKTLTCSTYA